MNAEQHRATHLQKLKIRDILLAALVKAQGERGRRDDFVDTATGPEVGWVGYERSVMLAETNRQRVGGGLPPISEAVLRRAESAAEGHCDYTAKFALYCAEIAVGEGRWERAS